MEPDAKGRVSAATTEQQQAKLKISHLEKKIRGEEPRARKAKEQNANLYKELDGLRVAAKKLGADLSKLGYEGGTEEDMYRQEAAIQDRIRELREQADGLKRRVANIDFNYADPMPNFDRSRVKGLVAQLFTLDKDKSEAGTALEITAGGRLYNVVVDTEVTGTQLLQNGKLRKRVTIIPLNKISAFKASAEVTRLAHHITRNRFTYSFLRKLQVPSVWLPAEFTWRYLSLATTMRLPLLWNSCSALH